MAQFVSQNGLIQPHGDCGKNHARTNQNPMTIND